MLHVLTILARFLPRWRLGPKKDMDDVAFRDPIKREYIKDHPFRSKRSTRIGTALELLNVTRDISFHLHEVSDRSLDRHRGCFEIILGKLERRSQNEPHCDQIHMPTLETDAIDAFL